MCHTNGGGPCGGGGGMVLSHIRREARQCATAGQVILCNNRSAAQQLEHSGLTPTLNHTPTQPCFLPLASLSLSQACSQHPILYIVTAPIMADSELAPKFAPFFSFVSVSHELQLPVQLY